MSFVNYRVLPQGVYRDEVISIRAVQPSAIRAIMDWRNSQMDVLRQSSEISISDQEQYFGNHVWPEKQKERPSQILFSIFRGETVVGYGGLTNISWTDSRGEVSFLLEPGCETDPVVKEQVFSSFLRILSKIVFEDLGLAKMVLETYSHRAQHIKIIEANGFVHEGTLRDHITLGNSRCNSVIHGLLADEWAG